MKVLIFEYISGGGFNKQSLPSSLLREGQFMLTALLANLDELNDIDLTVMLDYRVSLMLNTKNIKTIIIQKNQDYKQEFSRLLKECDAVWLIAPEFNNILHNLTQLVSRSNAILLGSPIDAIAMTANKWLTYKKLVQHGIQTVHTERLINFDVLNNNNTTEWLIKPIDGAGCIETYIITDIKQLPPLNAIKNMIIQPHIQGSKTSLSCFFKNGLSWLICVNEQFFNIENKCYKLTAIHVNCRAKLECYKQLILKIAQAIPTLWGYVGIDLIETQNDILVLEINPRLTSSFVAIKQATGINVAENTFELLYGEPSLNITQNKIITLTL